MNRAGPGIAAEPALSSVLAAFNTVARALVASRATVKAQVDDLTKADPSFPYVLTASDKAAAKVLTDNIAAMVRDFEVTTGLRVLAATADADGLFSVAFW